MRTSKDESDHLEKHLDFNLSFEERVTYILERLTLEEKITQLTNMSLKIDKLTIPEYDWRNECLHGVARAGIATVFPQAIALAATWNTELIFEVATAISDEARAKYNKWVSENNRKRWHGLTFSAPNINIFRDPRWGRGQETYGEDPYLTSQIGIAFVRGLQGDDPRYFKAIAEVKHYAVHSGPEISRHSININVSKKDLQETYLYAFKSCIQKGGAFGVMGAYNRLYDEPCCASEFLLQKILRDEWDFKGYVIADGGAIMDICANHKVVKTYKEAIAMALKAGCDIINPLDIMTKIKIKRIQSQMFEAANEGIISEKVINSALKRTLYARMKLGMFDPPDMVPFTSIPFDMVNCEKHKMLALQAARESIILLKNQNNILPLSKNLKKIAIIGPNAVGLEPLQGNYYGTPLKYCDPLEGIKKKVSAKTEVLYAKGCGLFDLSKNGFKEAIEIAKKSDIVIMFLGLTSQLEGEEGEAIPNPMGDRTDLKMPGVQEDLLKEINNLGKQIIMVITTGSALSINYAKETIPVILNMWYGGEEGGNAIADVLFGDYNPSGRLPITLYKSIDDLPKFEDYNMDNRTYRYLKDKPLYPFGFGLSYTTFEYSDLVFSNSKIKTGDQLEIKFKIKNMGQFRGQEVAQLYISIQKESLLLPKIELKRFKKIDLEAGEEKDLTFVLKPEDYCYINEDGIKIVEPLEIKFFIGGGQPNQNYEEHSYVEGRIEIVGKRLELD